MKFCKQCVQPDTRPGIQFADDGRCLPCHYFDTLDSIDWGKRREEIMEIAEWGKKHNVSGYDCIIGVSGGKDSTRQALIVKEELGLRPLMVCCSYPPEQLTERGAKNLSNLITLGFDCITVAPDPQVAKSLVYQGFFKFCNLFKSTEMALYASLPKVAVAYQIPLIFLGENPVLLYGDTGAGKDGGDANNLKNSNTLDGGDPKNLLVDSITRKDVYWYHYPSNEVMDRANLRMVYLGNYFRDFISFKNAEVAMASGLTVRDDAPEEIGSSVMFDALDDDYVIVNQTLKYMKFGFGKMTDLCNDAIHMGIMTREEGVDLVKKYDGLCGKKYVKKFCDYIQITEEEFWKLAESYLNTDIMEKVGPGQFKLKVPIDEFDLLHQDNLEERSEEKVS